jgi:phosphoglycolate phosphatase
MTTLGEIVNFSSRNEIFEIILNLIIRTKEEQPLILGVNGVDTSGKTIFSNNLANYLQSKDYLVTLIHLDDFHNPSFKRREGKNEIDAYINNAFNLEILENKILKPIKHQGELDFHLTLLDLITDKLSKKRHYYVNKESIVIVEGVLLYRPPIDKYFNARIFLDITFDEVLQRAKKRDVSLFGINFLDKYNNKYIPIQKWYLETYEPKIKCDILIDNNDYNKPKLMKIKSID